ncbi:MAG TPA: RNA methyltransferase [Prolixibacteraceae bacterium]|jgi:TrmH family RNA methyltransferase
MPEQISSNSNALIKLARSLRQKKARDENSLFFVEGILHVGEAAEAGWKFEVLFYSPDRLKSEFGRQLVERQIQLGVRCFSVTERVFESVSEKENPQGIAAIVHTRNLELIKEFTAGLYVAIVSPQDPGNIGTILRTMDAVAADGLILLDGGVDPYHPSAVRASMGAIFWKPFYETEFSSFSAWGKASGIRIIGTSAHAAIDYRQIKLDPRPTVLLMGSEQKGLSKEQMEICGDLISIPMRGRASSLNLAVATGILLYAMKG